MEYRYTRHDEKLLARARSLPLEDPPSPWRISAVFAAGGCYAGGWDKNNNLIVISSQGYSITDSITGKRLLRDRDEELSVAGVSDDYLHFTIPETNEVIDIFGLNSGDGIHGTKDGWRLEIIAPWWPRYVVVLTEPYALGPGIFEYLRGAHALKSPGLDYGWLKCGFSPDGEHFTIINSSDAYIYTRSPIK